jgi:serine/threonine protein kinase
MPQPSRMNVLGGRYRLESLLGQGGMGAVHRATDLRLERAVAVKVVSSQSNNAETRARFVREAQRTARVRHPNVVEVFDVGETPEGDLFFVMELLLGEPLSARLSREGRLGLGAAISILRELCDGLGAAHALGIVHRDVKPANVMLVEHGNRKDLVKVVDFGIAKAENSGTALTEAGMFLGTLEYISPEQILGDGLDGRADVYAIGALAYRMLTGAPLFPNVPRAALIHHHLEVMPDRPTLRAPDAQIPLAIEEVLLQSLSKEPARRFASASDLRAALDSALELVPSSLLARTGAQRPVSLVPPASHEREIQRSLEPPDSTARLVAPSLAAPVSSPRNEIVLELEDSATERGASFELDVTPRTALMARPEGHTCISCRKNYGVDLVACPHCGAVRSRIGVRAEPPPTR